MTNDPTCRVPDNWLTNGGGPVAEPDREHDDQRAHDRPALEAQLQLLGEENAHLRARLADTPNRVRSLEERLLELQSDETTVVRKMIADLEQSGIVLATESAEEAGGSLDWVYIDGDHRYDGIAADLRTYLAKVRDPNPAIGVSSSNCRFTRTRL